MLGLESSSPAVRATLSNPPQIAYFGNLKNFFSKNKNGAPRDFVGSFPPSPFPPFLLLPYTVYPPLSTYTMKTKHISVAFAFLLGILSVYSLHVPRHGDEDDNLYELSHNNMEHDHGLHHSAPLIKLNETAVLLTHAPDPLSYWSHDFEAPTAQDSNNWRALMILHVLGSVFASFILLPVGQYPLYDVNFYH